MGNDQANALRQCQLSYIYDQLKALNSSSGNHNQEHLVWIDTMCVPREPREKEMRNKAITLMRVTYEKAEKVLVLDAGLEATNHTDFDFLEIFARVICSGWTRRLWTLQEAFFAQSLWIQFRDEAINMVHMMKEHHELDRRISTRWLYAFLKTSYFGMRASQAMDPPNPQFSIHSLAMTAPGRSTENYADEPTCLSTLLGLPLESLSSVPEEERMLQFWRLLSESPTKIPDYIIFEHCPRLSQEGFRWAPSSILISKILEVAISSESRGVKILSQSEVRSHGLNTDFPGIQLSPVIQVRKPTTLDRPYFMRIDDGKWYNLYLPQPLAEELPMDYSQYAIIFSRTPSSSESPGHALLVRIYETRGNAKFVNRICPILVPPLVEKTDKNVAKIFKAIFQFVPKSGSEVEEEETFGEAGHEILRRDPSLHDCLPTTARSQHALAITQLVHNFIGGRFVASGKRLPDTQQWCVD